MATDPTTHPNGDGERMPPAFLPEHRADERSDADVDQEVDPEQAEDDAAEEKAEKRSSWLSNTLEFMAILIVALLISVLIKTFLLQAYYVPSGSMENTLQVGDRIAVNRMARDSEDIHRGDIVVFVDPGDWLAEQPDTRSGFEKATSSVLQAVGLLPQNTGHHLVKRVIGIGGDRVACCTDKGLLTVNGEPIEEPYLREGEIPSQQEFSVNVPQDHLWVMGDNRSNSRDSRYHELEDGNGFVPVINVEGRAWAIFYPFSHFGRLGHTDAFDAVEG